MIDHQEQYSRANRLFHEVAGYVERRGRYKRCSRHVLSVFERLARDVFGQAGAEQFTGDLNAGRQRITYEELRNKAALLRVIAGSRPGVTRQPEPCAQGPAFPFGAPFLSTLCAGAILYLSAVHFASVAPSAARLLIGQVIVTLRTMA